ncbi:MAG TPA: prolyl oligopeptidase family serine peptidase [Terriglobales bacterium]|nr:prolyl oligopeptidase family serine peptidase [Terriglobales bacterium]
MRGVARLLWILGVVVGMAAVTLAQQNSGNDGGAGTSATSAETNPAGPPPAKVGAVEDTLNGHKIADPYRWLENRDDPDAQAWVSKELAYTRSLLDPLPGRDQIHARLEQLLTIGTINTPQIAGPYYLYTRREGHQNQPVLYVRRGVHGKDRALLDVNAMAADGTVALDWWFPSRDGKYVAYGTSPSGSEISTLHVLETATGKLLPDEIPQTRAASLDWKLDGSGFYYTRYPKKGEVAAGEEMYNRHVFYHVLGSKPEGDPLIFGKGRDPQEWPGVGLSNDGRWLMVAAYQGWTKSELFVREATSEGDFTPLTEGKNFIYNAEIYNGDIYIMTNEDAPRYRVFKVAAANPARANWKEIIPQSDAVLTSTKIIGGQLFAEYEKNASSQLRLFTTGGKFLKDVNLPTIGTIIGLGGEWNSKEAFYGFQSYTVPPTIYHYPLATGVSSQWAKVAAPSVDSAAYQVKQMWFLSKDGTKVPMFVVAKRGLVLNGQNPTLLTGYGGFNISSTPAFRRGVYLWLEHGGVFAEANMRGGSEFGEDWHRAGMLGNKQNVFDDFIAAAEFLISQKYTDKEHLAIQGGSNGGLLMGAAFTQRPDLFRAVVCQVPLLDMLRYQNFQIAKLWIPEYGSADDAKQFEWLYAYSPYHHVKEGQSYPAILFMTADTDTRVDPMHAKKMAALMQARAANGSDAKRPILLRIEPKAGHGAGKPIAKIIGENTDIYSFLFWQLGVKP